MKQVKVGDIIIDSIDSVKMQQFYAELLNWKRTEMFGLLGVESENGIILFFVEESDFVSPVWPEVEGKQQKQMHFDFHVEDVKSAVAKAVELGGRLAEEQFGSEDTFVTVLDPSGHPLCLCKAE